MIQDQQTDSPATRRGVLAGAGLVGLAGALTACGADGAGSPPAAAGAAVAAGPAGAALGGAAKVKPLATTREIPVGGGKIFTSLRVVVTQPTAGHFKAFSAVCTHRGCIVAIISHGTIDCPCHGSRYSVSTGAVVHGPAPRPLPPERIKVSGGKIFLEQ